VSGERAVEGGTEQAVADTPARGRVLFPWLFVAVLVAVSVNLRSPFVSVAPISTELRTDLGVSGAAIGLLAWSRVGPWVALLTVLAALLVASVAYRVEPSRIDLDRPLPPPEREEGVSAPSSRADQ